MHSSLQYETVLNERYQTEDERPGTLCSEEAIKISKS